MSAASPAHNQVRRNAAAAPSRPVPPQAQPHAQHQAQPHSQSHAQVRQPAPVARAHDFSSPRGEEEVRLNLSDIPPMSSGDLEVEGFKPSLLSRLFDLVAPLDKR
ncbi:MAG: hypothetical protein ABW171_05840 [Steroidobacter sp.]